MQLCGCMVYVYRKSLRATTPYMYIRVILIITGETPLPLKIRPAQLSCLGGSVGRASSQFAVSCIASYPGHVAPPLHVPPRTVRPGYEAISCKGLSG